MLAKVLKITAGGLVVLGGYVFAYRYGYVQGLLDLELALEEDHKKRSKRPKSGYCDYYRRSSEPRDDIYVLNSREEAEEVLENLRNILTDYGSVTVADYKELIGITSTFTENKLGWTDLSKAEIIWSFDGWTVALPTPKISYSKFVTGEE